MKILLPIFLLILLFSPLASATSTTVTIQPSSKVLVVGDNITVYINVTPGQLIDTAAIDLLQWNPQVIDCTGITRGALFDNPLVWLAGIINNTAGNITLSVMASTTPTMTPGTYFILRFRAKAPGITTISIQKFGAAKNGTDLPKQILNNCQITVEGSVVIPPVSPPPTNMTNTTANTTTNTTANTTQNNTQPVNNTIPDDTNDTTDDTILPITPVDNTTQQNSTTPPVTENNNGFDVVVQLQKIPILIYVLIVIIVVSIVAYVGVRRMKDKRDEEEEGNDIDDIDDFFGGTGVDGEADSGSEL